MWYKYQKRGGIVVRVQHLVTLEYFKTSPDFSYPENELFLISPGTVHAYCGEKRPAVLMIVCFKSKSSMIPTATGLHRLGKEMQAFLGKFLAEAKSTFVFPFDKKLSLAPQPKLGAQQLIENYIEELLIKLIQKSVLQHEMIQVLPNALDVRCSIVREIKDILAEHIYGRITLQKVENISKRRKQNFH